MVKLLETQNLLSYSRVPALQLNLNVELLGDASAACEHRGCPLRAHTAHVP